MNEQYYIQVLLSKDKEIYELKREIANLRLLLDKLAEIIKEDDHE